MSAAPGDGTDARMRGQWLGISVLAALTSIVLLLAAVAIFGSPEAGEPAMSVELGTLAPPAGDPAASNAAVARYAGGVVVSDPALLEATSEGLVPRIGDDGRMAMTAYAHAFDDADTHPRIAVVLLGFGTDPSSTALSLSLLPPQTGIAIAPFMPNAQNLADAARADGHEVLLELPMEAPGTQNAGPGSGVLLVGAAPEENERRLNWAMSQFTGYVGAVNLLGNIYLVDEIAVASLLERLNGRGLFFLDNGTVPQSLTRAAAEQTGYRAAIGTLMVDTVQTEEAIAIQLQALEAAAVADGHAIGLASPRPETADLIARWAAGLDQRGIAFAPVTAIVRLSAATPR